MEEKIKILLVEDNPGDARLLEIYLKEAYNNVYSLSIVQSLSEGLSLLSKNNFDIIVLDLSLPDSEGLDTFKSIYGYAPQIPIIVLTGLDNEQTGINAMKLGAQDFLVKGKVKSKHLRRSINYSIERFKLLNELSENAKKLEEKTKDLLREQKKLSEAQKLAHVGSWDWDIVENILTWSDELCRIYGLSQTEFKTTIEDFLDFVHQEDKETIKNAIERSHQTLNPFYLYHRIVLPDDSVRIIHARAEVIADKEGKALKMIGTGQDVTERLHEEELEKLVLAATQSYNSVIIFDNKRRIEWVNEGFTKLTGYSAEDIINTTGEILRDGDADGIAQQKQAYEDIINKKKPITYENKNYSKAGTEYWVITTSTPVLDKDGKVERIIAIDSDITLRKQMEAELIHAKNIAEQSLLKGNKTLDELLKAKKQLEETMKVKEQFMANMSHEIRTPMNAIVGFTNLILKTELTPDQKQYTNAIKTSGENLLIIINDILDFSKIQSGKITFEKIDLNLSQVISSLVELMLPKAIEKNIKLSKLIDENIPDRLVGDPTRLNQILLNLVGNAIKFTQKGGIKINVELLSEKEKEVELKFSVIDTGIGICEDKLSSIFEGFTQESNETTRKYGGTGLGLTIVKQLVELQGGQVLVESKTGAGSVFSFNLHFQINARLENKKNSEVKDKFAKMKGLNILLVEDNLLNQILAQKILTDWEWNVDVAENGLIAIEKIEQKNFDLILMDIQMPEMDGNEATRHIRKKIPTPKCDIPIIAMTAHAFSGEAEKCLIEGMNDYISKPFDEKVLYTKIISLINKKNLKKNNSNTKNGNRNQKIQ